MIHNKRYAGIDYFRVAAAFLIIAIHTAPLEQISAEADYLVTYCIGRVAVPFFLMVTGYFVLAGWGRENNQRQKRKLIRYLVKMSVMYVGITLFYLPITIYAGNLPDSFWGVLKWFFMDGTFYHLWYLPALVIGCLITITLLRYCPPAVSGVLTGVLYVAGLLGDSYYGIVSKAAPVRSFYEGIFCFSTYTRNGIFFAPVFLWLGAMLGRSIFRKEEKADEIQEIRIEAGDSNIEDQKNLLNRDYSGAKLKTSSIWLCFAVSLACMLTEGFLTWHFDVQKHNSMYLFLLPVMYFMMEGLLRIPGSAPEILGSVSMWIYLLHPICIIGVRGAAKAVKLQKVLVDNQLIFYLAVCIVSASAAFFVCRAVRFYKKISFINRKTV